MWFVYATESLVGDASGLCDVRALVEEHAEGELLTRVADLDLSILTLVDAAAFADQSKRFRPGLVTPGLFELPGDATRKMLALSL